jgi:CheY-like chemotaxis protein
MIDFACKKFDLNEIINEYLESPELKKLLENSAGVKIETRLSPHIMNIEGSPVHLSKTIMNLVTNAAEAMPHGGTVIISTENVYIDEPVHGYDRVTEGDYILLTINDNGTGISQQDLPHIFEPFYTRKVMGRSGSGLGMAVVWGAVKDHLRYIDIDSEVGKGTVVRIYLPVTIRTRINTENRPSFAELRGTESILVVDDVEEQREVACYLLETLGYRVDAASGGEEALKMAAKKTYDLIVLDMIMDPGIDGLETYRRILEINPGQKAIIASGFSETDRVKRAQDLGAGTYIKKPYTMENLASAIRYELERETHQ